MFVVENENVYTFDVDKTLISSRRSKPKGENDIRIRNPYTKKDVYVCPHVGHIDLLLEMHGRGRQITVWSAAGVKWANAVIAALQLENHVHLCMTKPIAYVDDQKITEWLKTRIYLKPDDRT